MEGIIRIGFKLETDNDELRLVKRAMSQISKNGMDLVVANNLSQSVGKEEIRCRLVYPDGRVEGMQNLQALCESLNRFISENE